MESPGEHVFSPALWKTHANRDLRQFHVVIVISMYGIAFFLLNVVPLCPKSGGLQKRRPPQYSYHIGYIYLQPIVLRYRARDGSTIISPRFRVC